MIAITNIRLEPDEHQSNLPSVHGRIPNATFQLVPMALLFMAKEIQLTRGYAAIVDDSDFEWLNSFNVKKNGTVRYARRMRLVNESGPREVRMHRLILGVTDPKTEVDHRDGNGLNNQRYNLRSATRIQQARNVPKKRNSQWEFKGVRCRNDGSRTPWIATIHHNGRNIKIGSFETERQAAIAYNIKAKEFYGDFARLNPANETSDEISAIIARITAAKQRDGKSRFRGVSPHGNTWRVRFQLDGQKVDGCFETEEEAARFYDFHAKQKLGSKAKLNFTC